MHRLLPVTLLAFILAAFVAQAQGVEDYHEFNLSVHVDAFERIVLCNPISSPDSSATSIGVRRDSLGRLVEMTLFYFGNIDTRGTWSTMQIRYMEADTLGGYIERRTFHASNGLPLSMGRFSAQEIRYRADGFPVLRSLLDTAGKLMNDSAGVARSIFVKEDEGSILQYWQFNTGKLHTGAGSDSPLQFFAPMPPDCWFRRFWVDANGAVVREELTNFNKEPIRFPGGEFVRVYRNDNCGRPLLTSFESLDGTKMTDSNGIASIEQRYDRGGRVIEWKGLDPSGRLCARRSDGVAWERRSYRAFDDVLVRTERFNEKGEPLAD